MRRGPSARPAGGLIQVAEGLTGFVALLGLVLVLYSVTAYGPRLMLLLTGAILPLTAVAGTIILVVRGTAALKLVSEFILPGSVPGGTVGRVVVLYLAEPGGTGDGTGSPGPSELAGSAGSAGPGAGLGIPGMRARLSRVGGRLGTDHEPCPDGGQDFVADAWVPGRTG